MAAWTHHSVAKFAGILQPINNSRPHGCRPKTIRNMNACFPPPQDVLYKVWGPNNVNAGLGMDATDAYHAGSVRQQLIQQISTTLPEFGMSVGQLAGVSACPHKCPYCHWAACSRGDCKPQISSLRTGRTLSSHDSPNLRRGHTAQVCGSACEASMSASVFRRSPHGP